MSVSNTNPGTLFGGSWEAWGSGRMPVGVNASDTNLNAAEKTGGSAHHVHSSPQHTHGINSHSHTMAHTHTINGHVHTGPNHTHSFDGSARLDLNASGKLSLERKGNVSRWASNVTGTMTRGVNEGATDHSNVTVDATIGYSGTGNTGTSGTLMSNASSAANTGGTALTTNNNAVANTGSASSYPPYITCYMWKRIS